MDLVGATFSRFVRTRSVVCLGSLVVALWRWVCVDVIMKSSAYDIMFMYFELFQPRINKLAITINIAESI